LFDGQGFDHGVDRRCRLGGEVTVDPAGPTQRFGDLNLENFLLFGVN
jgi:hypothetical protein